MTSPGEAEKSHLPLQAGLGRELAEKGFWGHSRSEDDPGELKKDTHHHPIALSQQIPTLISQLGMSHTEPKV